MQPGVERGIQQYNAREFYACHETLEEVWMTEHGPSRLFIQSIIHMAVAFYHHGRSNPVGAIRQLRKGLRKLAGYVPTYEGVDTGRFHEECAICLAKIEQDQSCDPPPLIYNIR